jgi:hypothetical protein
MDERQRRWRHSDGKTQQEDAAKRPEIETSEPTNLFCPTRAEQQL